MHKVTLNLRLLRAGPGKFTPT